MKTLHLCVSLLFLNLTAHAGLHYAKPPKIEGMAGVPFGSGATQVKAAMDAHNATLDAAESDSEHLIYTGGTFNDERVTRWNFFFDGPAVYKANVILSPAKKQHFITYNRVLKALSDKYGDPSQPADIGDEAPSLYDAVNSGKTRLEAIWHTNTPSQRHIACQMFLDRNFGNVIIKIIYQDDTVAAQLSNDSKKDL
jgi:hypothetical protein